ncbi:fission 1 (mitochondrial outer membrane) homolog (S. cerevisiae) [Nesidiocoris tenuis]|uniref:Mitochondrial fission 1 protein n=1 Tax=Nesidiocoris tenuis TaxID=355587 RepID=A0ABN7AAN9_9HEMI|nr:fission 1 (mitochondrial outer membrane) homolog (S. cerevisiae) [Nesidiocoris tenuis]
MEEILDEPVSSDDLKKFEAKYYKELGNGLVSKESTFNYAWCLVRSKYASDIRKGILFLEDLFRDGNEKERRDYMYYLAIGHAKIREHPKALHYIRQFLTLEPGNQQVQNLEVIVKKRMERDGMKGMAIAGGLVVAVGSIVGLGLVALAKKK